MPGFADRDPIADRPESPTNPTPQWQLNGLQVLTVIAASSNGGKVGEISRRYATLSGADLSYLCRSFQQLAVNPLVPKRPRIDRFTDMPSLGDIASVFGQFT